MKKKNQFTHEQKYTILESAGKIGIKEAAKVAGIHYTTVYEWRNRLETMGQRSLSGLRVACTRQRRQEDKQSQGESRS